MTAGRPQVVRELNHHAVGGQHAMALIDDRRYVLPWQRAQRQARHDRVDVRIGRQQPLELPCVARYDRDAGKASPQMLDERRRTLDHHEPPRATPRSSNAAVIAPVPPPSSTTSPSPSGVASVLSMSYASWAYSAVAPGRSCQNPSVNFIT